MSYKLVSVDKNDKINGYLFADNNPSIIIGKFMRLNLFSLFIVLIKNPKFIKEKFFEFIKYKNEDLTKDGQQSIYLIATDPNMKGQGIASRMLNYFEDVLKSSGLMDYSLNVRINNEKAINFYLMHGFKEKSKNKLSIHFEKTLD